MADVHNGLLAAGIESAELPVTPLVPLTFNSDRPCQVLAKNTVAGTPTWGLLYDCKAADDVRIIYPTSALIKVKAGPAGARVLITT